MRITYILISIAMIFTSTTASANGGGVLSRQLWGNNHFVTVRVDVKYKDTQKYELLREQLLKVLIEEIDKVLPPSIEVYNDYKFHAGRYKKGYKGVLKIEAFFAVDEITNDIAAIYLNIKKFKIRNGKEKFFWNLPNYPTSIRFSENHEIREKYLRQDLPDWLFKSLRCPMSNYYNNKDISKQCQ